MTAIYLGSAAIEWPIATVPLAAARARAGFPSPAEDFQDDEINLHQLLIRHPSATFLYRADGWSMTGAGILDGDILVVDRSIQARSGDVVIAVWDGNQPSCKILELFETHIALVSAAPDHPTIEIDASLEVELFVVTGVVRQMSRRVRAR